LTGFLTEIKLLLCHSLAQLRRWPSATNYDIVRLPPIGSCCSENISAPIDHYWGRNWMREEVHDSIHLSCSVCSTEWRWT
jgi:hypothetical protein